MNLITRQSLANIATERWKENYLNSKKDIYNRLVELGENPHPDDVDRVIGNTSWTKVPRCDECGEYKHSVIQVGQEPDYESNTANMCRGCLIKAYNLV